MNNDKGRVMTFKIVIIYLVLGSAWILFSDQSLLLVNDAAVRLQISLAKGWLFIVFTACVLYGLISFDMKRIFQAQMKEQQANKELLAVHEELVASEEALRIQVEELSSNDCKLSRQNIVLEALHETVLGLMDRRNMAEQRIHDLVHFDALTGLPNRRLLQERMELAMVQCQSNSNKMAVLFLDLDRFKTVNDSLGRDLGDLLLRKIGWRLQDSISKEDTVSRQNADEFIVALTHVIDRSQVQRVATELLATVAIPCVLEGTELVTCATIGISIYPDDGQTSAELLKNAEAAMIYGKENSYGGCQFFTVELNHIIAERVELENSLRKAIYNDEFVLYYQPQIDIVTGGVVGVEALIRWQHPVQGLIAPGKFIAIAEATGLIIPIGEWVIKEVCRQNQSWQRQGLMIPIALNISAVQFMQADFCNMMEMILLRTGIDPSLLELELTEGVVMKDADQTIDELKRLKALGLRLSIDDFGTGYSSLSYLRRFPIDKLKIDQSFVRYMTTDKAALAIIEAIIALGHSLGLTVIAEGVETELELDMLRQRSCQEVQGYYFARPMSGEQLTALFGNGKFHSFKP